MTSQKNTFFITRTIKAPRELVFDAFASRDALAAWWGPVGHALTVKDFDFRPGGRFLYEMEGYHALGLFQYIRIERPHTIEFINSFADADGKVCKAPFAIDFPLETYNKITLEEQDGMTILSLTGHPHQATEAQIDTYHSMADGMTKGFGGTFDQLDRYLEARLQLKKETATKSPRVTTYLNFPGTTEEAFLFYKQVFGTEFNGAGIKRFSEIPHGEGQPPMSESMKNLILHIELPILGGHVLMATDASKEMGFTVTPGNNMYINLEPADRAETTRLFNALSEGGTITMPLQDMFFGSYYGSLTDKYGIQWMLNCTNQ